MKRIIVSLLFLATITGFAHPTFADPAPFGLEIGKATVTDAEKMYRIEKTVVKNNFTTYRVPVNQVNFDGLKELAISFNEKGVLIGVIATLPKSQFKSLHDSLSKKYKVVSQEIPFVGDSFAEYVNGSTVVFLDAPHLSFDLEMMYIQKDTLSIANAQKEEKEAAKKKSQEDKL